MADASQEHPDLQGLPLSYKHGLIRFCEGKNVFGAGFHVCGGYLLTCAHVVAQCLGISKWEEAEADLLDGKELKVDFVDLQILAQRAVIVADLWKASPANPKDIAVLKLLDPIPSIIKPLDIAHSDNCVGHTFRVYGFPSGNYDGAVARGEFIDEQLGSGWWQLEDTKGQGLAIEPGFSGAPVWNETLQTIVGITVARDAKRKQAKLGYAIPYKSLKPVLEAITLYEILMPEKSVLDTYWPEAYRLLQPKSYNAEKPKTLAGAVVAFQDMPSPSGSSLHKFIAYLACPEHGLSIREKLADWLEHQDADLDTLLKEVQSQITQKTNVLKPHILFWVQAALYSSQYSVKAYIAEDRDNYDPKKAQQLESPEKFLQQLKEAKDEEAKVKTLQQMMRACLNECLSLLPNIETLSSIRVEVFLPLHCMDWDVEAWPADEESMFKPVPERIGCRYNVVVRSSERLDKKICDSQTQHFWNQKWEHVIKIQHHAPCKGFIPSSKDNIEDASNEELFEALTNNQVIGLILTKTPQPFSDSAPGPFPVLIGSGVPVALWPRQNSKTCSEACRGNLNGCLSELPIKVMESRKDGQNIALLWEDPKLIPPSPQRQKMPG